MPPIPACLSHLSSIDAKNDCIPALETLALQPVYLCKQQNEAYPTTITSNRVFAPDKAITKSDVCPRSRIQGYYGFHLQKAIKFIQRIMVFRRPLDGVVNLNKEKRKEDRSTSKPPMGTAGRFSRWQDDSPQTYSGGQSLQYLDPRTFVTGTAIHAGDLGGQARCCCISMAIVLLTAGLVLHGGSLRRRKRNYLGFQFHAWRWWWHSTLGRVPNFALGELPGVALFGSSCDLHLPSFLSPDSRHLFPLRQIVLNLFHSPVYS